MDITLTLPVLQRLNTLGDATRCRILGVLDRHELAVTELRQALQLPQSTVSRHLRVLADAGWVESRSEGSSRFYAIASKLTPESRSLWAIVRDELSTRPTHRHDLERASSTIESRVTRSKTFFSESAPKWEGLRNELYGSEIDLLPFLAFVEPEWVVADLGCGTGSFSRRVRPYVGHVIGVDRSEAMLEEARGRARLTHAAENHRGVFSEGVGELGASATVEYRSGRLESLPIDDEVVDLAVLSLVLHVVPDPRAVLGETQRILKPGGRVLIVDMRTHERTAYRIEMGHLWQGFSPNQITGWLAEAGFEGGRVTPARPDPLADGPALFVASGHRGTQPNQTLT